MSIQPPPFTCLFGYVEMVLFYAKLHKLDRSFSYAGIILMHQFVVAMVTTWGAMEVGIRRLERAQVYVPTRVASM